jgi:hypothetical protein
MRPYYTISNRCNTYNEIEVIASQHGGWCNALNAFYISSARRNKRTMHTCYA